MNANRGAAPLPVLMAAFFLCLLSAGCGPRSAEAPFTLKQIGAGVWAAIDNPNAQPSGGANAGFVIGDDGVVVIDTFASVDAAKQLLTEIRDRTKLPVRFVINTHYHLDHVAGNGIFAASGLGLAQRNVRDWIHTENLRLVTEGMAAQHQVITPAQRALIAGLVAPTAVYDGALDLYLGARHLRVRTLPGHTGGDSVVLVPDAQVAFAGDLFWHSTAPNTIDASTIPWIETLNMLANDYTDYTFVPGHGDIGTAEDVLVFRDYLATLRRFVSDAQAESKAGGAVVDAVLPRLGTKYSRWAYFKDEAASNILQADAELRGTKRVPSAPPPQP